MEIKVKREHYRQLLQCAYLGNLIVNEYRSDDELDMSFVDFLSDILIQIIKSGEKQKPIANHLIISCSREKDHYKNLIDLNDLVRDSVNQYYEEYRRNVFAEILAEKIS